MRLARTPNNLVETALAQVGGIGANIVRNRIWNRARSRTTQGTHFGTFVKPRLYDVASEKPAASGDEDFSLHKVTDYRWNWASVSRLTRFRCSSKNQPYLLKYRKTFST